MIKPGPAAFWLGLTGVLLCPLLGIVAMLLAIQSNREEGPNSMASVGFGLGLFSFIVWGTVAFVYVLAQIE